MSLLMRAALIEYKSDFLGPIPNVVIFQFNPETLQRDIQIPPRPTGATSREEDQAGESPVEQFNLTAHFSAADRLGENIALTRVFGVGTQLAALEKMVQPPGQLGAVLQQAADAIGDAIRRRRGREPAQPIPRDSYPRILFVWGHLRVLPVVVESMSITEQEYDNLLNPIRAEVALRFSVIKPSHCSDDIVARGAMCYSDLVKDTQAMANLGETGREVYEFFQF
jgi:hypothetical protein